MMFPLLLGLASYSGAIRVPAHLHARSAGGGACGEFLQRELKAMPNEVHQFQSSLEHA